MRTRTEISIFRFRNMAAEEENGSMVKYADKIGTFPVCAGSVRRVEISSHDYIEVRFTLAPENSVTFLLGDFCLVDDECYMLCDRNYAESNISSGGYDYTLRLDAQQYMWKNHLLRLPYNGRLTDSDWKLTDTLEGHLGAVCENLALLGFERVVEIGQETNSGYRVAVQRWACRGDEGAFIDNDITGTKFIQYSNVSILDALNDLASKYSCEWWVENLNEIHFGFLISSNETVVLEEGVNAERINRSSSSGNYANRLAVLGGSQNIPDNYRKFLTLFPTTIDQIIRSNASWWRIKDDLRVLQSDFAAPQDETQAQTRSLNISGEEKSANFTLHDLGVHEIPVIGGEIKIVTDYVISRADITLLSINEENFEGLTRVSLLDAEVSFTNLKISCKTGRGLVGGSYSVHGWLNFAGTDDYVPSADYNKTKTIQNDEEYAEYGTTVYHDNTATIHGANETGVVLSVFLYESGESKLAEGQGVVVSFESAVFTIKVIDRVDKKMKIYIFKFTGNSFEKVHEGYANMTERTGPDDNHRDSYLIVPLESDDPDNGYDFDTSEGETQVANPELYFVRIDEAGIIESRVPYSYYTGVPTKMAVRGIAEIRLLMPEGRDEVQTTDESMTFWHDGNYISESKDMPECEIVEGVEELPEIFPRETHKKDGEYEFEEYFTIRRLLQREENTGDETFSDNSTVRRIEPIYTFFLKDESGHDEWHYLPEYIEEGNTLEVIFQSGLLAGMKFGLKFNPEGLPLYEGDELNYDAQSFEIVINDTYGRRLPDQFLKPAEGDKYLITGWSPKAAGKMGVVDAAERELLRRGADLLQKRLLDGNNFDCVLLSDAFYRYGAEFSTSDAGTFMASGEVFLVRDSEETYAVPTLGQRVSIKKDVYGMSGDNQYRVTSIEYPLDLPYDHPKVSVGMTPQKRRLKKIEQKLKRYGI